jgi:hypothetical protein
MTDSLFGPTIRLVSAFVVLGFVVLGGAGLLGYWLGGMA